MWERRRKDRQLPRQKASNLHSEGNACPPGRESPALTSTSMTANQCRVCSRREHGKKGEGSPIRPRTSWSQRSRVLGSPEHGVSSLAMTGTQGFPSASSPARNGLSWGATKTGRDGSKSKNMKQASAKFLRKTPGIRPRRRSLPREGRRRWVSGKGQRGPAPAADYRRPAPPGPHLEAQPPGQGSPPPTRPGPREGILPEQVPAPPWLPPGARPLPRVACGVSWGPASTSRQPPQPPCRYRCIVESGPPGPSGHHPPILAARGFPLAPPCGRRVNSTSAFSPRGTDDKDFPSQGQVANLRRTSYKHSFINKP